MENMKRGSRYNFTLNQQLVGWEYLKETDNCIVITKTFHKAGDSYTSTKYLPKKNVAGWEEVSE